MLLFVSLPGRNRPVLWHSGLLLLLFVLSAFGAEVIPPKPQRYFNDYAGVVSAPLREQLNSQLEQLEKSDSTQIIVAIFQKMQSDSSLEDYTVRVAESWGVGQRKEDNGAVLFLFVDDRAVRIEVGYGLEGKIPDAIAKRIIEDEIIPAIRGGSFDNALSAGVAALIQAARGEYSGAGTTVNLQGRRRGPNVGVIIFIVFMILIIASSRRRRRGTVYGRRGRTSWGGPIWMGGGGGGGGRGFGGGGFSGGGGSFGGGGASGRW